MMINLLGCGSSGGSISIYQYANVSGVETSKVIREYNRETVRSMLCTGYLDNLQVNGAVRLVAQLTLQLQKQLGNDSVVLTLTGDDLPSIDKKVMSLPYIFSALCTM